MKNISVSDACVETMFVGIEGMTCRSCELLIEHAWKSFPRIADVSVDRSAKRARISYRGEKPSLSALEESLPQQSAYRVHAYEENGASCTANAMRPSAMRLVGLIAVAFLLMRLFSNVGFLKPGTTVSSGASFGAIFIIGLFAAASSCIAVTGGLLLSLSARFHERYGSATPLARMRPVALFVFGRIAGYTILGGALGLLGEALSPSPIATGVVGVLASILMLFLGLDMLKLIPPRLLRFLPRASKRLSHRILEADRHDHAFMPVLLGAATFFLPCGFTQALQFYAITTKSFSIGAWSMFAFALGTAPGLILLGFASGSLKGKAGTWFLQFSGVAVMMLGMANMQNGLSLLGYPIEFSGFGGSQTSLAGDDAPSGVMENGTQVIRMRVAQSGYAPDHFTLRAGTPVRWDVDAKDAAGCGSVLVSRSLGIQKLLSPGVNSFSFTPEAPGTIAFSCSMGMYRGSFTVLPSV